MYILKNKIFIFLICLFLNLPPIFLSLNIYKPILSAFPNSPELEVHFYLITLFIIFTLLFSFYFLSFKINFLKKIVDLKGKVKLQHLLFVLLFLMLGYLIYFIQITYPFLSQHTTDFRDIGVNLSGSSFNISLLISSFTLTLSLFFIITRYRYLSLNKIFYLCGILIILWLTFVVKNLNDYDFAYFAGPINDVLHGKYLLHNSPSQYGFLSIIFLSLIFRVIPLSLMNLTIVNAVIVTLGFILVFFLLQLLYKNKLLSLFTIVFIIFLNHTIQIVPEITFLQTSFLRFGMWVVFTFSIALQLFYSREKYRNLVNFMPLLVLAIAFFWNLDNGFYILTAYLVFLTFNNLNPSFWKTVKNCLVKYLIVFFVLLLGILLVEISYRFLFGIQPNWRIYLLDPFFYLGGFSMFPWPNSYWPWIVVGGYLTVFIYFLVTKRFNNGILNKRDQLVSFILFYGIFQFVYFVGESHLNNLHHIITPFIICSFYLVDIFLSRVSELKDKKIYLLSILLIALVLSLPMYLIFLQGKINIQRYNLSKSLEIIKVKDKVESEFFQSLLGSETIDLIRSKYGSYISNNGITLISANDTWFLIKLDISNNLDGDYHYFTNHHLSEKVANEILQRGEKYVFIDTKMQTPRSDSIINIYNIISNKYEIIDTLGTLHVVEKKQ